MLIILGVAYDYVWYEQTLFDNSNFCIPNGLAKLFERVFLKEINAKITLIWGHVCLHSKRLFVALPNSSLPLFKSGYKLFD